MKRRKFTARIFIGTIRFVIPVTILLVGVFGLWLLIKHRPDVPKATRDVKATFVEVKTVHPQHYPVWITAYGSIQAHRTVVLQPQVSGRVIAQTEDLIAGGVVKERDELLKIDPSDYRTAVEEAIAAVTKSEFDLKVEEGNQVVAQREWQLLDDTITPSGLGKELALRKPHLQEKQAAVKAAKSRLFKARLDLERTTITAPFNALVISESVEIGQIVTPQTSFATLVGTDEFQVQVSVPVSQLNWINIPVADQNQGSAVSVIHDLGDGRRIEREGTVIRLLGNVDPNGRMARLLVTVDDPLGLKNPDHRRIPLLIGSYVRALIQGPVLDDVYVIPRSSLREGNRIWIKNRANKLEFRDIEIVFSDSNSVVVRNLRHGTQIVTSAIPVAMQGMLLDHDVEHNGPLAKE